MAKHYSFSLRSKISNK